EAGRELRFVDARTMLREPYEVAIRDHGAIATRLDGPGMVHDWCNALAWLAFPRTKARLNALHTHPVAAAGSKAHRSPLRDAATLFDESGAYIVYRSGAGAACGDVWPVDALRALDWPALFVAGRQRFRRDVRVLV